jgi:phage major head subunit gpT-like protein
MMSNKKYNKYKVGDEVVFLTTGYTYNTGVRFTITKVFFQMKDPSNPKLDIFSYDINHGIQTLRMLEKDLYWIPAGTIDRLKEK